MQRGGGATRNEGTGSAADTAHSMIMCGYTHTARAYSLTLTHTHSHSLTLTCAYSRSLLGFVYALSCACPPPITSHLNLPSYRPPSSFRPHLASHRCLNRMRACRSSA
jgi:hypothetical protein